MRRAVFVDTSILDEILAIPGWSSQHVEVQRQVVERHQRGDELIIPITALVESGNHVAQCSGSRRDAATRFKVLLDQLVAGNAPWRAHTVAWDVSFLRALAEGAFTGQGLVNLYANRQLGGGDLAILVEAKRFHDDTYGTEVEVWTEDATLLAYWEAIGRGRGR